MLLLDEKSFNIMQKFCQHFLVLFFTFLISPVFASQTLIIEPDQGTAPLIHAITHAKSSVDLVMYGLTDLQFVDALSEAKSHGKSVRVLLQEHPYLAYDENSKAINQFQTDKINLHWPSNKFKLTHQKTLIIDDNYAIIMTFNFTHSTFKNERNFALIIDDPAMIDEIKTVFNADWQHKDILVHDTNLVWSPDNSRAKLLQLIHEAKNEIKVYAEGLTDYEIIGALASAARKGTKVQILTSTRAEKANNKKATYLSKAGVDIRFSKKYMVHAKVMLFDNATAIMGSINMTKPSIDGNRELSIITHDPKIIHQLTDTFNYDWQPTKLSSTAALSSSPSKTTDPSYVLLQSIKQLAKFTQTQHFLDRPHKKYHRKRCADAYRAH